MLGYQGKLVPREPLYCDPEYSQNGTTLYNMSGRLN